MPQLTSEPPVDEAAISESATTIRAELDKLPVGGLRVVLEEALERLSERTLRAVLEAKLRTRIRRGRCSGCNRSIFLREDGKLQRHTSCPGVYCKGHPIGFACVDLANRATWYQVPPDPMLPRGRPYKRNAPTGPSCEGSVGPQEVEA
jgi:hypothetical protein